MARLLFAVLVQVSIVFCHLQYIEKQAVLHGWRDRPDNGDDFSFAYPLQIDTLNNSTANGIEDARFVHSWLPRGDVDYFNFTVQPNTTADVSAVGWVAACDQYIDRYVSAALLGPLSNSRFQPVTYDMIDQFNIRFHIPDNYGIILGYNTAPPPGQTRPVLDITIPQGEFPNSWYVPYNSGEQCPGTQNWCRQNNGGGTGVLGCVFPPGRCPGRVYPDVSCDNLNYTAGAAFCPHFMVGDFCGPKPWRWIKEVGLEPGKYYLVFWENNYRPVDVGYMVGWRETLRFGYNATNPLCANSTVSNIKPECVCGTKNNLVLPPGCIALDPQERDKYAPFFALLTEGGVWHGECDLVSPAASTMCYPYY